MTENYRGCYEYLSAQFEQVGGYDFTGSCFRTTSCTGSSTMISLIRVLCISTMEKMSGFIGGRCITIPGSRTIRSLWSRIP